MSVASWPRRMLAAVSLTLPALALLGTVAPRPALAHGQWLDAVLDLRPERPNSREPAVLDLRLYDRLSGGPIVGARVTYRARLTGGRARVEGELKEFEAARYAGRIRLPAAGNWRLVVIVENLDEVVGGSYLVAVDHADPAIPSLRGLRDPLGWVPESPVPARPRWPAAAGGAVLAAAAVAVAAFMRKRRATAT